VVAHYRPPEPTTGTHFAILFHASASEEKLSFGGEFLSAMKFYEPEMTEGVLVLNWLCHSKSGRVLGLTETTY
jgi:hypothetical protein